MTVQSAQSVTILFSTRVFITGVGTIADSLPTGTLYLNGTANGATVTVTNISGGLYKAQVTLPTLAFNDVVALSITATVSTITDTAVVWGDNNDLLVDANNAVKADLVDILGTVVSTPATAGILDINVKNMNNVAATAITTIKAVQGLTTADTIATYTGNTKQTVDAANIKTVTDKFAFTVANQVDANTLSVNGDAAAAANLAQGADALVAGHAITGTLSTTQMSTNLTETDNDQYKNRSVYWTSGALAGSSSAISAYTGSTKVLTYAATTTGESPANLDTFVIA